MRAGIGLVGLAATVGLAIYLGQRISSEALAVLVGVVCGIVAGVPAAVLLLLASGRRERVEVDQLPMAPGAYPPVVVVQGGGQPSSHWPAPLYAALPERDFGVTGEDGLAADAAVRY